MINDLQSATRHHYHPLVVIILSLGLLFATACAETPLTGTPEPEVHDQVAFTAGRAGHREVYIMEADGTNVINVTNDLADDWYPAWTVDRKRR
jgi:hypothetical protein